MPPIIAVQQLGKTYASGFKALKDINLDIRQGEIFALLGPNGAGKTTLINLLTGFLEPSAGTVTLMGRNVTRSPQYRRCLDGLVRTFQISQLFSGMTVLESVALAASERKGLGNRWWRPLSAHAEAVDAAAAVLEQLGLLGDAYEMTRNLAYGRRRLLEIALALALEPKVLLLDEPAAGVPASESSALFATIAQLPRSVTVLLIEHDMDLVFRFAEFISVLVAGAVLVEGSAEDIARHPRVREVYLGEGGYA